jgi:hypothetical protein
MKKKNQTAPEQNSTIDVTVSAFTFVGMVTAAILLVALAATTITSMVEVWSTLARLERLDKSVRANRDEFVEWTYGNCDLLKRNVKELKNFDCTIRTEKAR